jgi:hypothetical protein
LPGANRGNLTDVAPKIARIVVAVRIKTRTVAHSSILQAKDADDKRQQTADPSDVFSLPGRLIPRLD